MIAPEKSSARRLAVPALFLCAAALVACKPTYPRCKSDDHCSQQGEVCFEGVCRECAEDRGCREGYTCKANHCEPAAQCAQDGDCKDGRVCRAGKCEPQCTEDAACARGEKCLRSRCVDSDSCASDGDCAAGRRCDANHRCVAIESVATDTATATDTEVDDEEARRRAAACSLDTVYFEFNDFTITEESRAMLDRSAACITKKNLKVTIEGHADERGTEEFNLVLSDRRASAVRRYLMDLAIPDGSLKTVGFGEERPADPGHDEAAWAKNRRTEFVAR